MAVSTGAKSEEARQLPPRAALRSGRAGQRVRIQAFKVRERHIAGQNLLKLHLRPPSRRGCFDRSMPCFFPLETLMFARISVWALS